MEVPMGECLTMADQQRVTALLELVWSYRRIERETGVRRETVARDDPRRVSKPAKVSTGSASSCEPYRDQIVEALAKGLTAQRIWQDLKQEYGLGYEYASVKRFVRCLRKTRPEVAGVMPHPPGKEGQVDYFQGPPTLDPASGRHSMRR
jgi:transposase